MRTPPINHGYGLCPKIDQRAARLIEYEVLANQTDVVEHLLETGYLGDEMIWNWPSIVCPHCSGDILQFSGASGPSLTNKDGDCYDFRCTRCGELSDYPDKHPQVFEWWLVSSYLATELYQRGEIVVTDHNVWWWGRTHCIDPILRDGIMQRIVATPM